MLDPRTLPTILETDDLPKKKLDKFYKVPTPELIAYLDFSVSTTGVLSGVKVSWFSSPDSDKGWIHCTVS